MVEEIKTIYSKLSHGKQIVDENYLIMKTDFNSIIADRFISELNKRGLKWNGEDISFKNLISSENNYESSNSSKINNPLVDSFQKSSESNSIGIDLQHLSELPIVIDYWEDDFYNSVFCKSEIAYCITKNNPLQSFAGIFASKEAIIKAGYSGSLNSIEIEYTLDGKPYFQDYLISISHSDAYAIAVALKIKESSFIPNQDEGLFIPNIQKSGIGKLFKSAIIFNIIITLCLSIYLLLI